MNNTLVPASALPHLVAGALARDWTAHRARCWRELFAALVHPTSVADVVDAVDAVAAAALELPDVDREHLSPFFVAALAASPAAAHAIVRAFPAVVVPGVAAMAAHEILQGAVDSGSAVPASLIEQALEGAGDVGAVAGLLRRVFLVLRGIAQ